MGIKDDWNNIRLSGQVNMFLGLMLVITTILFPRELSLSAIAVLMGLVVMLMGASNKVEPHPEYQKKTTDFIEDK